MNRERAGGALLVLAAAALWSTGGVGVKIADAAPLVVAGLRSAFGLLFIGVVLVWTVMRRGLSAHDVVKVVRRPFIVGAAISYAVMVVLFVLATRRTTAANAIMLQYAAPIYVALLGGPLLGERTTARDLLLVLTCFFGIALAFGGELGGGKMSGNVLAVVSGFGFAGLPLCLRMDQTRTPEGGASAPLAALVATALGNLLAMLVALPVIVTSPPTGEAATRTWLVLAGLGTLQIGLPYVLYGIALRRLRALESSLLATVEAVLSPVWVVLATGERPSPMAMAGGAVIIASVAAQAVTRARER